MKKKQRDFLRELVSLCNQLGGNLDPTSTHESKLWDRQKALMDVYHVVYAVLVDHPENYEREHDWERAFTALNRLKQLTLKTYPDRTGTFLSADQTKGGEG